MVQAVMSEKGLLENKYIVAHCRFLNFFEQVEVTGAAPATKDDCSRQCNDREVVQVQ